MLPWIEIPSRLICWLDMNQFGAQLFLNIGASLNSMSASWIDEATNDEKRSGEARRESAGDFFSRLSGLLSELGCMVSSEAAKRLASKASGQEMRSSELHIRCDELRSVIFDEMKNQKFFWVPLDRSGFYGKTGKDILGEGCVAQFSKSDIANEAEQAAKCFAFGQYTACVFHLMRITEAGVRALGLAINYQWEDNPNWGRMFKMFDQQSAADKSKRTGVWQKYGDFLEDVGGHFRAVKNAWRNDTMHLDKTYDEDQAKHLLTVIPAFMKQLSSQVDEEGAFLCG